MGKFGVTDDGERPSGFFIYDLSKPENKVDSDTGCIDFVEAHVYHFAPYLESSSISYLVFLDSGKLKFFKELNCRGRGDRIEDVVAFLDHRLKNGDEKASVLQRVKDYRKYGKYFSMDSFSSPPCEVN